MFDELRQTVKNIEFLADPTAGELTVGSITPLAASFVSTAIDRISRRCPRITFRVVTKRTNLLHQDLLERTVDLLVVRKFGPIADDRLNFEPLFDDSLSSLRARKAHGRCGATLGLLNWQAHLGLYYQWMRLPDRSHGTPSAPAGSIFRARQ